MKRLTTVLLVLATACRSGGAGTQSGPMAGAESAEKAIDAFVAAARAQDLQAMGAVWGTAKGLARDELPREQLELRELTMMRLLCHESHRLVQKSPGVGDRQLLRMELKRGTNTVQVVFTTVAMQSKRWVVEDFETARLPTFCR